MSRGEWWEQAVVYQIYPRSFQDSDDDGEGDLQGIASRLDHLVWLGVDALWLSPIHPSPRHDGGYDVADYDAVDPRYGTLADFDALVNAAHDRGLRVLMDLVPSHTSIEHPWFLEHPDWYVTADGDAPPNNWVATFGGPAWSPDPRHEGRWYLHSFYPEQPDLDWRNPEVVAAMQDVVRRWIDRGVDGFRVDAIDRLMKDPRLRDDPPAGDTLALPQGNPEYGALDHANSVNAPDIGKGLAALREAAGDAVLIGEVYLPTAQIVPYLDHLDTAFSFELLHAPFEAPRLRHVIAGATAQLRHVSWVLSNHDFPRLPDRVGAGRERAAAMLLLMLPGATFIYQGDEIGMRDGPGTDPPVDRAGRDAFRHPMQWDPEPLGGFTTGRPWLPVVDPERRSVALQREDPGSLLRLYRELIALRHELAGDVDLLEAADDVIAFRRGRHVVAVNLGAESRISPLRAEVVLESEAGAFRDGRLWPGAGVVFLSGRRRRD